PSGAVAMSEIDISTRHHWWWALVVIMIGVFGSFGLKYWVGTGRQRTVQQVLLTRLRKDLAEADRDSVRSLLQRVDDALQDLSIGQQVDTDQLRREVDETLPLLRQIQVLSAAATLLPTNTLKPKGEAELRTARETLAGTGQNRIAEARKAFEAASTALQVAREAAPLQLTIDRARIQLDQESTWVG